MKLLIILIILTCFLTGCNNKELSNTISTNNVNDSKISNNSINTSDTSIDSEFEISSFSTKIYTTNDAARQNNLRLTCSFLNGTIVGPGETFSFCDTVGKATPERGYQKADIFDKNGNVIKGYGGGNCQISSTLYNAVLKLDKISIIERHKHSKKVYYVPEGKDAAVAYGSIDFKFKNNFDNNIKIYASTDNNNIYVKIVKL